MTVKHAPGRRTSRRGRSTARPVSEVRAPLACGPGGIVYLAAPHGGATGGPEAIHQLAAVLQALGADARIVYVDWVETARGLRGSLAPGGMHPRYAGYETREAVTIEDSPENVLVLPEIWTQAVDEFRHIQTAVWWLSVDNNLTSLQGGFFGRHSIRRVTHLYQSAYAEHYLRSHGVRRVYALGDYLNPSHGLDSRLDDVAGELGPRGDFVLFNPMKGLEVTEKIAARAADRAVPVSWLPLSALSAPAVALLMRRAKVYVDFGPHPGMDRLPREAAVAGCCVITGRRGAAAFDADLPIPPRFRIDDDDIDGVVDMISECVTDFERASAEFDTYRAFIAGQKDRFVENSRSIFGLNEI